jgi:hypothetical protein
VAKVKEAKKKQPKLDYSELLREARSGLFHDTRVLALSVGVMLLYALGLLLK